MNQLTQYDLRCGNILNYLTSEGQWLPSIIDWQDIKWISEDPNGFNKVHKPIPLTEECLMKLGFKPICGQPYGLWIDVFENTCFFIDVNLHYYGIANFNKELFTTSKNLYVHNIQNLYHSLTGNMINL